MSKESEFFRDAPNPPDAPPRRTAMSDLVETFHHWFQQNYPLYERDGRDTTIKRKMEQAWNSAQKASADTIAVLKAKCEKTEKDMRDCSVILAMSGNQVEQMFRRAQAAEAKCVELEKANTELRVEIEAWKRQEPLKTPDHVVYQMCPRHIAYPWPSFTAIATYVPPPRAVCPICEPPSASLRTSETTGEK